MVQYSFSDASRVFSLLLRTVRHAPHVFVVELAGRNQYLAADIVQPIISS